MLSSLLFNLYVSDIFYFIPYHYEIEIIIQRLPGDLGRNQRVARFSRIRKVRK